MLPWHLDQVKGPQHFGHEELPLHPGHLPADAGAGAKAKGMKGLEVIVRKRGIIPRMARGEPARRPVVQWVVVEAWTAGEGEDAGLYMGLSDRMSALNPMAALPK